MWLGRFPMPISVGADTMMRVSEQYGLPLDRSFWKEVVPFASSKGQVAFFINEPDMDILGSVKPDTN